MSPKVVTVAVSLLIISYSALIYFHIRDIELHKQTSENKNELGENVLYRETPKLDLKPAYATKNTSIRSIIRILHDFPFKKLKTAIARKQRVLFGNLLEKFINVLTPLVIMEPKIPINKACFPSVLKEAKDCKILKSPRKVGVLLQFGFDVDSLEIHLNELGDLVDQFFILESTRTNGRAFQKPLVWELIKTQPRFAKFLDKVVHFVLDDGDLAQATQKIFNNYFEPSYEVEYLQEKKRWEKFLLWNNATKFFGENDILGFGDTDEIPSREAINRLKHCEQDSFPVDIGIWFPFGNIRNAFWSDFQVGNYSYSLGDPTYWTLKSAMQMELRGKYPNRNRGTSPSFLLGGMHMTHYGYLPLQMIKTLTGTESGTEKLIQLIELSMHSSSVEYLEKRFAEFPIELIHRLVEVNSLGKEMRMDEIAILPWFFDCNRQRYPAWEDGHDTRLDY